MAKAESKSVAGMLSTVHVELPFEDEDKAKEAAEMNASIAHLGVRVTRSATDWAFIDYKDGYTATGRTDREDDPRRKFQSGDLVKIFKTVSDGDVLWSGEIDYDRSDYHHGIQQGFHQDKWSYMFYDHLPAKLEKKDGTVIYGALEPFCETGTEGVIWSVHEYGKSGYDGLNCLEEGEKLTVFSSVRDGEVEWEGELDFSEERVTKIGWTEILRETKHMNTEDWLQMSWQNRPVIVTPKP